MKWDLDLGKLKCPGLDELHRGVMDPWNARWNEMMAQDRLAARLSSVSPMAAARRLGMALCRTDLLSLRRAASAFAQH